MNENYYNLLLNLDLSDVQEYNNTFDAATAISIGDSLKGTIRSVNDVDFYKFETFQDGVLDILITSVPSNIVMQMILYDNTKTSIYECWNNTPGQDRICEFLVKKGTYYIGLSSRYGGVSNKKLFNLSINLDVTDAQEYNNTFDDAVPINIGDSISGAIRSINDIDVFQFEAALDGALEVLVNGVPANITMQVNVFDSTKTLIDDCWNNTAGQDRSCQFNVKKGINYISLYSRYGKASNKKRYHMETSITY